MTQLRTVSYGGGVQSTALLVLAARGVIDFRTFLFSNVGDDSEHPETLRYVRDVAAPYAEAHGIELVELRKRNERGRFAGEEETLWKRLMHPDSRSLGIPVRMSRTGAPGTRSCTADFKIRVVAKELRARGATEESPALVALGISTDEIERAKPGVDPRDPMQVRTYPLLDLGYDRTACKRIIADAGLPVPPKSSCFFCPFHSIEAWRDLRNRTPELFDRAQELEDTLNERRARLACAGVGDPPAEAYRSEWHCEEHGIDCPDPLSCDFYVYEHPVLFDLEGPARLPLVTCRSCEASMPPTADGRLPWHGKDPVWLTPRMLRLSEAVDDQLSFGFGDDCDSGYCFT